MKTMVIRFSSVGDIVLCGGITSALAPVIFVTKPAYRSLAETLPGVVEVLCPPIDALPKTADKIVDLHGNWRSRQVCRALKGPVSRIKRYDLKRRFRVWFKQGNPPPSVLSRYAEAAAISTPSPSWGRPRKGTNDALAIIPFCRHATKEWPLMKFAEIGRQYNGPVVLFCSEEEIPRMRDLKKAIGPKAHVIAERGFESLIEAMGDIKIALGGDSGLTHLCAAYGKPVVVLFGPTQIDDGFWPNARYSASVDLPCRPCSRFGGEICPMSDHLCMNHLSVDHVWQQLSMAMS